MHYLPLLYYSAVQLAQGAVLLAMTFRLAAVQLALTHSTVGVLMQSMHNGILTCSVDDILACSCATCVGSQRCRRWHSHLQPCIVKCSRVQPALGSQRCRCAHAVDGILIWSCAWLTALSSMALSLAAVQPLLAHSAVGVLMQSMAFSYAAVQLALVHSAVVNGTLTCSRAACVGSQRCLCAHAVDGTLTCSRTACSWLTALSACSCSRWHSHLQLCSFLLAHSAVGVRAHAVNGILICSCAACSWLTALSVCSCSRWHSHLQPCSLRWLTALSVCSCSRWRSHVQLCSLLLAHGAVGVLMQSMAFSLAAVQIALGAQRCRCAHAVDGILTCSHAAFCSRRWHSHLQPCSLLLDHSAVGVLMRSMAFSLAAVQLALGSRRCRRAHAVDGILTCSRAACVDIRRCRCADAVDGILICSRAACSWLAALSACSCG
jgi:hypothetical protein